MNTNPYQFYLKHMNLKTGYRAAWDPGRRLSIGQIGKLDSSGVFNVYTDLAKEEINLEVSPGTAPLEMDYTSHDSVSVTAKLSGTAPAAGSIFSDADAGFSFNFKNENSVVFQASGCRTHQIINMAEIERRILAKYRAGNWDKDWLIVAQLVIAESATIVIANSNNASLELKAHGGATAAGFRLTDGSLELTVAHESGSTLKYVAQSGLTPLYRLIGIRDPFFGHARLDTRSTVDEAPADEELIFRDVTENEFN